MGNNNNIRIVLGSLRYKSAPNTDFSLEIPLIQNNKQNVEYDRTSDISLLQVYDDERQKSTIFRPACKFSVLFKNAYAGYTNYTPFENNLYYLDTTGLAALQCQTNANAVSWSGLPQYNEFDFIRTDYNVSGYTQPPNNHILFTNKSASTYNWNLFVSYPFQNDFTKQLSAIDGKTGQVFNWTSGDGVPFIIESNLPNVSLPNVRPLNLITFRCPIKHGLNVGESVKLSFNYNGDSVFQVFSLGDVAYGSEEYIFSIIDIGYTGTTFNTGTIGTFKRIVNETNTADTISRYYVRKHRIITNVEDTVLAKAGFEENVFGTKKKFESSAYTPNYISRVSVKEGAQSYSVSLNKDIDLNGVNDNLNRPVSELFFTVIWKGYFGWTYGLVKQGYEFNLPKTSTNQPSPWWSFGNTLSNTQFTRSQYNNLGYTFYYVDSLKANDIIDGDLCEWNDFEQKERVMSELYHKFTYNPLVFNMIGNSLINTNPVGYYYKPHYSLKIRDYSSYIEEFNVRASKPIENLPNYAYFSTTLNKFIWRDLYTYGFTDTDGNGVNYPFLNGGHYPFKTNIFRIIPEGTNYTEQINIAEPLIDECE